MRRVKKLLSLLSSNAAHPEIIEMLVLCERPAGDISDPWERKVVNLCDGRSVRDLIGSLYRQELREGGWASDIGMWKGLFEDQVVRTIAKLEQEQIVRLSPHRVAVSKGD